MGYGYVTVYIKAQFPNEESISLSGYGSRLEIQIVIVC